MGGDCPHGSNLEPKIPVSGRTKSPRPQRAGNNRRKPQDQSRCTWAWCDGDRKRKGLLEVQPLFDKPASDQPFDLLISRSMNAVPEPQVDEKPEAPADSRLPRLVRWGVRATSVPVLGMLMISLVPALASFSISSRDDKMLALALCGIAIGFLIGWR